MAVTAAFVVLVSGCVSDGPGASEPDATTPAPVISVTIPPSRLTPFCESMIDLSDRLRGGEVDDDQLLIIQTYRSIEAQVPPEIASDFTAVLVALETGAPAPTDPPLPTTPTTVPTSAASTGSSDTDAGSAPGVMHPF